jgi:hypothetical protein
MLTLALRRRLRGSFRPHLPWTKNAEGRSATTDPKEAFNQCNRYLNIKSLLKIINKYLRNKLGKS